MGSDNRIINIVVLLGHHFSQPFLMDRTTQRLVITCRFWIRVNQPNSYISIIMMNYLMSSPCILRKVQPSQLCLWQMVAPPLTALMCGQLYP